jgi:hypothetical protein
VARVTLRFRGKGPRRTIPFGTSAAVHAGLLFLIVTGRPVPPPARVVQTRATLEKSYTVTWYPLRSVPRVSPSVESAPDAIPRPLPKAERTVLSTDADARRRKQLIWQQAPKVRLRQEVPAPNILQFSAPALPAPPPKTFAPPPLEPVAAPSTPVIAAPDNPLAQPKLPAPSLSASAVQLPKPAPRRFVPPSKSEQPGTPGAVSLADVAPAVPSSELLNALVVGIKPSDQLKIPLPPGSLPSQVSARPGEIVKPTAGASGTGGLIVPNVIVREGAVETAVVRPPAPRASVQERASAAARATLSAPLYASSRVLPAPIEAHFGQRTVYTCLIEGQSNVPNSTMWFAEMSAAPGRSPLIRAPVLVRAQASPAPKTGGARRLYLKLLIGQEGLVKSAGLLQTSDDPISQNLATISGQWEFVPATRNGQPIEIEAILEVAW